MIKDVSSVAGDTVGTDTLWGVAFFASTSYLPEGK